MKRRAKFFDKNPLTRKPVQALIFALNFLVCHHVPAGSIPVLTLDARTAAMGGAGIAQAVRNATFYNPGMLAVEPDRYEWYVMPYSNGDLERDPDDVKDGIEDLAGGGGNVADIDGKIYQDYEYSSSMIAIPSETLGGAMYFAEYKLHSAKVENASDLVHRSVDVKELGVSVGKLMNIHLVNMDNVMVGVTAKIYLFKSYGYTEPVNNASLVLDRDQIDRDSQINFDVGFSKEYGVWKTALVIKNLLRQQNNFGDSDEEFETSPQAKVGMAYKSRRAIVELNLDLLKSEGLGFASDTQNAAIGWEWRVFPGFFLRLGYNQNLAGDTSSTFSSGFGIDAWGMQLDFAVVSNDDGNGAMTQLGFEF